MTTHDPDRDFHQFRHFDRPQIPSAARATEMRLRLEAVAREFDHLDRPTVASPRLGRPARQTRQEEHMTQPTITTPVADLSAGFRSRVRPHMSQVQTLASFGLVLVVLLSLIAVSFDRMTDRASQPGEEPSGVAGLTSQEETPGESNCVARSEPWDASISALSPDRPARYTATRPAPAAIGDLALETYLDYMTCAVQKQTVDLDQGENARINEALRTYQTANGCSAEVEVGPTECVLTPADPLGAEFLATAPITLNRPPQLQQIEGTRHSVLAFDPGDVYEFFDGRYGVIMGSPSTAMFRDGFTATENLLGDGVLIFVAFREHDGLLYIDEFAYVFIAESQPGTFWPSAATPEATG